jgi:hypothetical protein
MKAQREQQSKHINLIIKALKAIKATNNPSIARC